MKGRLRTGQTIHRILILCLCFAFAQKSKAQSGEAMVDKLVDLGFENVSWSEDHEERIYMIENAAYRLSGIGVGKAIDQIQKDGLPDGKPCRLIIVDNNIPIISLHYKPILNDTASTASRRDWDVSYDLGNSWNKIKKEKRKNSSLFKVDIVIYPELSIQNLILNQIYQALFNLSPAIEISLWKGMKFTGQIIFPIYNDFGQNYNQVRQGYITIAQTFRLPENTFVTATMGTFNANRWGFDVAAKHYLKKDERFSVEGRIGYTGVSTFDDFVWHVSPLKRVTWTVGGNFYWPKYNTQMSLKVEQYLLGEKGVRFDLMRNFRYTSIGIYAMKAQHSPKNGGFYFQIALPPYGKYKRNKFRITAAKYFGQSYNGSNERYYGKSYTARLSSIYAYETNYNPYFIKSELLNY